MQELKDNNEAHFADAGGFVSPMGISYVGASKEKLGEAACCAVKVRSALTRSSPPPG